MNNTPLSWQVPDYRLTEFSPKSTKYAVVIPVINEGSRIQAQLQKMQPLMPLADVIIGDGGSTDGSLEHDFLQKMNLRALLVKTGPGKLSAQLRMLFAYALTEGYEGVICVDGNNKDSVENIPDFIQALESGYEYIQGSRYIPGGREENTPSDRKWAVKLIHAPLISLAARLRYTDTTNGFRAIHRRMLDDSRVQPFRDVFDSYNLHFYLSIRAGQLGFKSKEIPVTRRYPAGIIPSKISGWQGKYHIMKQLLLAVAGAYNP
jgi:dolichol-phosphate mannosyltransferase